MKRLAAFLAGALMLAVSIHPLRAEPRDAMIPNDAWKQYLARFVDSSGRVVDDANNQISHSEGQGYGMLLAFLADDRAAFERIWSFTRTELLIRDDGLAAWRWDPGKSPHITDVNAASDGDLLIAYALARAGESWNEPGYTTSARRIAKAIGKVMVIQAHDQTLLLPGAKGFSAAERPDGPILNPSYWIFEALPVMAQLAPETNWNALGRSGLDIIRASLMGPAKLPPDWISYANGTPRLADGFPPVFGYNSLRIVLYLLRAGMKDATVLATFQRNWLTTNGGVAVVDIKSGRIVTRLTEPGYRMLGALLACTTDGVNIPDDLRQFQPTLYYPSTLHLLSLALVLEKYPQCL
ncbi:glycosyl hydrolase family 8 [Ancylobacter sp. 6x-1]|uniref:cellulase n=1 Tax=Ancylobacter crimeensis TaxID=2579147 RepID=A0ABT0DB63_9HYPH|nr:glycosyl hydrolase family 8 [Ancylobacter crimeensis]MCK0197196.1 glycosyl hydrolase family 8 [Ancylobacter crimeensis]